VVPFSVFLVGLTAKNHGEKQRTTFIDVLPSLSGKTDYNARWKGQAEIIVANRNLNSITEKEHYLFSMTAVHRLVVVIFVLVRKFNIHKSNFPRSGECSFAMYRRFLPKILHDY